MKNDTEFDSLVAQNAILRHEVELLTTEHNRLILKHDELIDALKLLYDHATDYLHFGEVDGKEERIKTMVLGLIKKRITKS